MTELITELTTEIRERELIKELSTELALEIRERELRTELSTELVTELPQSSGRRSENERAYLREELCDASQGRRRAHRRA